MKARRWWACGSFVALCGVVAVLGGPGAASASAAVRCAVVVEAGKGVYKDAKCTEPGGNREYIWVLTGGKKLGGGIECAVVVEPGSGTHNNALCNELGGSREYIKVIALPRARWGVGGLLLAAGETRSFNSTGGAFSLEITGVATIACSSQSGTGKIDGTESGSGEETLKLSGCGVVGQPACTVRSSGEATGSGDITFALASELIDDGAGTIYDKFSPLSGETLATVVIEGSGCAAANSYGLKGTTAAAVGTQEEEKSKPITFTRAREEALVTEGKITGLKAGKKAAFLNGESLQTLVTEERFAGVW